MCGIVGYAGPGDRTLDALLSGLATLEYRGYDSAGVALRDGDDDGRLTVLKREGDLDALRDALAALDAPPRGTVGIGHTRWSTHGPPSDRNAHPHTDDRNRVAVVHNGIVDNHEALRADLVAAGHEFTSETDTEVLAHLFADALDDDDPATAFRRAVGRIEGSYAVAAVARDAEALFAARRDSPLVVGVGDDATYVASDVPAFLDRTRDVVYVEDDQFVVCDPDGWRLTDADGAPVDGEVTTVDWEAEQTGKSGYDHFMLKEIHEQPTALRQCLTGRVDELSGRIALPDLSLDAPAAVHLVACGTSYHAALYGERRLRRAGVPATAHFAHEYATVPPPLGREDLVVGITQSGETADTLRALREAASRGATTLAMTNVVGSTAARECDHAVYIRAGPEIGVAATKTFSSQLVALTLFVEAVFGADRDRDLVAALRELPAQVQEVLDVTDAPAVVEEYLDADGFFFIGRGDGFPVALEGALKFKEITYEHAEGFAAGELKHGPLALVTGETPVFAVVTGDDATARRTVQSVKEVQARDAPVVAVTDRQSDVAGYADHVLDVPVAHPRTVPVLANVQLQLVAYHVAAALGRPIDRPRNLAKSVTVE
ncbi:MAG: glutamine--fructose-6-phosphate transaminase (isomerizing) [Haloferacaceae archaeon]